MTTRDIKNSVDAAHSLEPALRPTATYNGAGVDLQGYNEAMALVYFGAYTNGTHTPSLQESDDNSTYTNVANTDMDGTFAAVSGAGGANTVQRIGYRGSKRYLRVVMTVASGATGAASAAIIVRGAAASEPV
jgi:hypothetical protein